MIRLVLWCALIAGLVGAVTGGGVAAVLIGVFAVAGLACGIVAKLAGRP